MMKKLNNLIRDEEWRILVDSYSPNELATQLPFKKGMVLSKKLLENKQRDSDIQTYAIDLIKAVKNLYPNEWESNWKHEAYLGYAYDFRGWDYEEQFDAYNRAAEKATPPPPEILMRLAINWSCPGVYKEKMDETRAIEILERALKETPYVEGVSCLIQLYRDAKQKDKESYWQKVILESEQRKFYAPYAFLDFFSEYE